MVEFLLNLNALPLTCGPHDVILADEAVGNDSCVGGVQLPFRGQAIILGGDDLPCGK